MIGEKGVDEILRIKFGSMEIGGPRHLYRENLIVEFIKEVLKKGRILDAGCGCGTLVMALAKLGFKVSAFDLSDNFVETVQKKITDEGLDHLITVDKGDARRINFPDQTFNGVVSGEVLEHIQDDVAVVREYNRVMKNDGVCVITVPINPKLWDICDEMAGHIRRYKSDELMKLFEENGFVVEKIRYWGFPVMWLYHKLVFSFWVKKIKHKTDEERKEYLLTKIGIDSNVSKILALFFKIDNIFNSSRLGIGTILRARKVANV